MPELPEVETTRRGLAPYLEGATVTGFIVRCQSLRWPIPKDMPLTGQKILRLTRRAKYLLVECTHGTLILHLGMSGSLRILSAAEPARPQGSSPENIVAPSAPCFERGGMSGGDPPALPAGGMSGGCPKLRFDPPALPAEGMSGGCPKLCFDPPAKHDHFDLLLDSDRLMRLRDPRRFGAVLWHEGDIDAHPLLAKLGPEPAAADEFNADYLYAASRGRNVSVKQFIMDGHIVVGVGNIYASEALYRAAIRPQLPAGKLSRARCEMLVQAIRQTLDDAIRAGGSTLRDFTDAAGNPGYFQQQHWVYDRGGEPCRGCGAPVVQIKQGQRSTFYCRNCQK